MTLDIILEPVTVHYILRNIAMCARMAFVHRGPRKRSVVGGVFRIASGGVCVKLQAPVRVGGPLAWGIRVKVEEGARAVHRDFLRRRDERSRFKAGDQSRTATAGTTGITATGKTATAC
jgi:hypothetical protein